MDAEKIAPRTLVRVAKQTGLTPGRSPSSPKRTRPRASTAEDFPKQKRRQISVAGIGDAGPKTNSMKTGIIDPGYKYKQKRPAEAGRFELD